MIKKLILAAACCLPLSAFAQKGFTIHGKVGNLNAPTQAVLIYFDDGKKVADSVVLHQGEFSFSGRLTYPSQSFLYILRDPAKKNVSRMINEEHNISDIEHLIFYLENSDITIIAKDSIQHATVKGSATEADAMAILAMNKPYDKILDTLKKLYYARTPEERKDHNWRTLHTAAMENALVKGYDSVKLAFISGHPNSFFSLLLFKEKYLPYGFNADTASAKFANFPESQRKSVYGQELQTMIDNAKSIGVGKMAADFTESDPTGKMVSLSDFRGHYVLLDFWASWCAPCREENPNYLQAYNKYKDKNFTIVGVSMDDEKGRKAWLNAVKEDNLPWTQISELKGFKSKAAILYSITGIPTNFLIDPNGKIIAMNLRGKDLMDKLSTLINGEQK